MLPKKRAKMRGYLREISPRRAKSGKDFHSPQKVIFAEATKSIPDPFHPQGRAVRSQVLHSDNVARFGFYSAGAATALGADRQRRRSRSISR